MQINATASFLPISSPGSALPTSRVPAMPTPEPVKEPLDLLTTHATATGSAQTLQPLFLDASSERQPSYQSLISELRGKPEQYQLNRVNGFFNDEIQYVLDSQNQGQNDYWQTPKETLNLGKGDCEDFAIAKFQALKELGIPAERLHLFYVKAAGQGAHMVLTYHGQQGQAQVLDNLSSMVLPASQRTDLTPVFAFNPQGIWAAGSSADWLGAQLKQNTQQISRYQNVLKRLERGQ